MSTSAYVQESEPASVSDLVLAAQAGDRLALGELFQRFERHLFAVALRRVGNFAEAQELVQDVFLQVMEKLDQLRQPEAFAGWIRMIATRMAINRAVRRAPLLSAEPETLASGWVESTTPEAIAMDDERDSQVHAGLRRLGPLDRETLVAFYVEGRSLAEMSDDFHAPLGTIKRRLHVARKRLAKEVEEAGCGV